MVGKPNCPTPLFGCPIGYTGKVRYNMATLYVFPKQVRKPKSGSTAVVHSKRKAKRTAAKKTSNLHSKSAFTYTIDPTNGKTTTTYSKRKAQTVRNTSKPKKNRFAGADGAYTTNKYFVREDVSTGKDGRVRYSRRYIKKDQRSRKEYSDIFGSYIQPKRK